MISPLPFSHPTSPPSPHSGTGLFKSNYTWGDDLNEPHLNHPIYCNNSNPIITNGCDAPYGGQQETRDKGKAAGAFLIIAIITSFGGILCGWLHVPGHGSPINAWRAFILSLIATISATIGIAIYTSAPIYSNIGYNFACHFIFEEPLNSNALVCHAVGPGWAVAVSGTLLCAISTILFWFAYAPTPYLHWNSGRYSLFLEEFTKRGFLAPDGTPLKQHLLMAEGETTPPIDTAGPIRRFLRAYGIPLILIGNAALFLWSNCSTGATVEPHAMIQLPKWLIPIVRPLLPSLSKDGIIEIRDDVFNFTLVSSLRHFWSGKAYWLAVLIGAFSGTWPYVKIITMLFLWFVPASERLRGRALHWLDILGKWSLIDAYVLCLMSVAFAFETDTEILGIRIQVDIQVRPGWGVYSFVLATMWSLGMSHWMSYKHRHAVERRRYTKEFLKAMRLPPHEALHSRPFAPLQRHRRFKCSRHGRLLLWIIMALTLLVTILGETLHTFEFQFSGLAELILPPEKLTTQFSLISLGKLIPHAARNGGYLSGGLWAKWLTLMFFAFAMVIPLIRLLLLALLWSVPMTLRHTRRLFHLIEVIAAWSAMDVFIVSVIASVLEIGGLSQDVIGDAFGSIQDTVCRLLNALPPDFLNQILNAVGLPDLDLSNGCTLFRVDSILLAGCWLLLLAVIACELFSHIVMELAEASITERMAMLSAYHRTRVVISPGLVGDGGDSNNDDDGGGVILGGGGDSINDRTNTDNDELNRSSLVPSRSLRILLEQQEEGAEDFVGSWFDFMYGPFPRKMWAYMADFGLMRRVEWSEVGAQLHDELVRDSPPDVVTGGGGNGEIGPSSSLNRNSSLTASSVRSIIRRGTEEDLDDSRDEWMPESPATWRDQGQGQDRGRGGLNINNT